MSCTLSFLVGGRAEHIVVVNSARVIPAVATFIFISLLLPEKHLPLTNKYGTSTVKMVKFGHLKNCCNDLEI